VEASPGKLHQVGVSQERLASPWVRVPDGPYTTDLKDEPPSWWGKGPPMVYEADGCDVCSGFGYHGRTGIYELLLITDRVRSLLLENADSTKIKRAAIEEGMDTLRDDGAKKAFLGTTSLDEIMRVTQEDIE
jgi:general secretion pathway protein E